MTRRALLLLVLLVAVGGAVLWWVCARPPAPPPPPEIKLDRVPPELATAVREARDAVIAQPKDIPLRGELAFILVANQFYDEALPVLATLQDLDPNQPAWPYLYASVSMIVSRPKEAAERAEQALALPATPEQRAAILYLLIQSRLDLGQVDQAGARLEELTALDPNSPQTQFAAGLVQYARGDRAGARRHLERVAEHPSARKQAAALLATLVDDPTLADSYRARNVAASPDLPWPSSFDTAVRRRRIVTTTGLERFNDLRSEGRIDEAIQYLQEVAATHPSEVVCQTLGYELLKARDYEGAERYLRQAVEFNAANHKARMLLGSAQLEWAEQLRRDPAKRERAAVLFRQAAESEQAVIEAQVDSALSRFLRARALAGLGRRDEAKSELRRAVLQSPDLFEAHLALGELLAEGGQLREALDSFENAGRVAPPGNKQAQEAIEKWRAKAKPVKP